MVLMPVELSWVLHSSFGGVNIFNLSLLIMFTYKNYHLTEWNLIFFLKKFRIKAIPATYYLPHHLFTSYNVNCMRSRKSLTWQPRGNMISGGSSKNIGASRLDPLINLFFSGKGFQHVCLAHNEVGTVNMSTSYVKTLRFKTESI